MYPPPVLSLSVALYPGSRADGKPVPKKRRSPLRARVALSGLLQRFYGMSTVLLERVVLAVVF